MALHIVESQKQKFIVGLFWQSLSDPKTVKDEVKSLSQKLSLDYHVLRSGSVLQAGFAASADGAEAGMVSLAAVVAETIDKLSPARSWMAAVALPDNTYAYFAARDGALLPEGDFASDRVTVLSKMQQDFSIGIWDKVYAPEDFGFSNAEPLPLADAIPSKKGKYTIPGYAKLKPVSEKAKKGKIIAAAVLVVLAGIGYKFYADYAEQKALEEMERKALELALKKAEELKNGNNPALAPELPHPWITQPPAMQFTQACSTIDAKMLKPGGWVLTDYVCNQSTIDYKWERNLTPISYLLSVLPNVNLDMDGAHATLSDSMSLVYDQTDDKLKNARYAVFELMSDAQTLGLDMRTFEVASPPPVNMVEGQPIPVPKWKTYNFMFNTSVKPTNIISTLNRPGLRVTEIKYKPFGGGNAWSVSGVYYASLN